MDHLDEYVAIHKSVSQKRQQLVDRINEQISKLDDVKSSISTSTSQDSVTSKITQTDGMDGMETLVNVLLRSDHLTLSVCMKAQREYNVDLEHFLARRTECMNRILSTSGTSPNLSKKRIFRDYYKAMRDVLMPTLHNASIVYSQQPSTGIYTFSRKWIREFVEKGVGAISECKDIVELNSLWTQSVLLNNIMSKHGVSFMPLLESSFIDKAVELCSIQPTNMTVSDVEKTLLDEEQRTLSFIDNPEQVAVVNAIIDSLNLCRHFAHPTVLRLVSDNIEQYVNSKHPNLMDHVHLLLGGQVQAAASEK